MLRRVGLQLIWNATRSLGLLCAMRREGVRGPLPDVAGHVTESITVRGEGLNRRGALVPIDLQVLPGESTLPCVGHHVPRGRKLVAPDVGRTLKPAAGGELPLGLRRQLFSGPGSVCSGVLVSYMYHRVLLSAVESAARALGTVPVHAGRILPPGAVVAQVHRTARLSEHQRT